jgi:hypothetical protein
MRGISNDGALVRPDGGDVSRPNDEANIAGARVATGTLVADRPSGDEQQASSDASLEPTPSRRSGRTAAVSVMGADLFPPGLEGPSRTQVRLAVLTSIASSALSAVRRAAKRGS